MDAVSSLSSQANVNVGCSLPAVFIRIGVVEIIHNRGN